MSIYPPENVYYVYAYLRSKNSTTAPAGTPYYIGKGSNGRAYSKNRRLKVPDRSNIILLETNLSENKAFEIEKFLIAYHGRKDIGTGILLNRTDGGDGASGAIRSEETKTKMSEAKIGRHHTEESKTKMSEAKIGKKHPQFGKPHTEEIKKKLSTAMQALPIVKCPHCGKQGKGSNMTRYHFHNCKLKS